MPPIEAQAPGKEEIDASQTVESYESKYARMRLLFTYYAIGSTCAFGLVMAFIIAYIVFTSGREGDFVALMVRYPGSMLGVPFCTMMALLIVLLLRTVEGPIEFSAFGISFKGASGPILMWVICFAALAWATKYLWDAPGGAP